MKITKTEMKDTVETVANYLDGKLGSITTLELKDELRNQFPVILWNQYSNNNVPGVSDLFHELVNEGKFKSIADNGTYQTYRSVNNLIQSLGNVINKTVKASPNTSVGVKTGLRGLVKGSVIALAAGKKAAATRAANKSSKSIGNRILRTTALNLMKNNKGRFFTATFIKKDGSNRTINCQYVKNQIPSTLGYVLVKEAKLLKSGDKEPIRNVNLQTLDTLKVGGQIYTIK